MKRWIREWLKIAEVGLVLLVAPTALFYWISLSWFPFLDIGYHFLVGILVVQAALSYWYTASIFCHKKFVPLPSAGHCAIPKTTFIVSAYLPNELQLIRATLSNILERVIRPADGLEVILAYNTPHMEELELKLRDMAFHRPELILANAYGSRSKSENLNHAIDLATGEMIVLLDADHLVEPDCLGRAWRWLDGGYDVVQGRCKIRNSEECFLARVIEVEFDITYGVNHPSQSIIFDTSLFGGSNGYWRASALRKIKFLESTLTEDIDTTLRALLDGCRFVNDRSIVSTELAPTTVPSLWFQRKRWSQGWFQCSVKYQMPILKTARLNLPQKFTWTSLLLWRVFYDVATTLLFPILFAFWIRLGRIELPLNPFIVFSLVCVLLSGPFQAVAAYKNATKPKPPLSDYLIYAFFVWPYTLFKVLVHMIAIRDEWAGERSWIVSKRTSVKA
jgi:glycosyltransferase involved in cell wall biosynthesis